LALSVWRTEFDEHLKRMKIEYEQRMAKIHSEKTENLQKTEETDESEL